MKAFTLCCGQFAQSKGGHSGHDTALSTAVQQFNKGSSALVDVKDELKLTTSNFTTQFVKQADTSRVEAATRKTPEKENKRRKQIDIVQRRECQEREEREELVYGAG